MTARSVAAQIKGQLASALGEDRRYSWRMQTYATPGLHELLTFIDGSPREKVIRPDTVLVVDGFPRSGQSRFVAALSVLSDGARLCTHAHSPYIVEKAARRHVPCAVLVREPMAATASLVQFLPGVHLGTAAQRYAQYYDRLMDNGSPSTLIGFERVVTDLTGAVKRLNRALGLNFRLPITAEDEIHIGDWVERSALKNFGPDRFDRVVARPSERRLSAEEVWGQASARDRAALARAELAFARVSPLL